MGLDCGSEGAGGVEWSETGEDRILRERRGGTGEPSGLSVSIQSTATSGAHISPPPRRAPLVWGGVEER